MTAPDQPDESGADKPDSDAPGGGKKRGLRGRGSALGAGGLADQLKRRAQAAAADAAPHVRELAGQAQRLMQEGAAGARAEAERRRSGAEQAAKDALGRMREAAERAKPEVERRAREARQSGEVAAEALKPQVSRVASDAAQFARDHESELKGAAGTVARTAARRATPAPLRPAVDAFERELQRKEADTRANAAPDSGDDTHRDDADRAAKPPA